MNKEVKRFGDLRPKFDDVEKFVSIDDILNRDIVVDDVLRLKGDYGDYIMVKFYFPEDGTPYAFVTGGKVIMELTLLAKEKNLLPLLGQIKKVKRYYVIE